MPRNEKDIENLIINFKEKYMVYYDKVKDKENEIKNKTLQNLKNIDEYFNTVIYNTIKNLLIKIENPHIFKYEINKYINIKFCIIFLHTPESDNEDDDFYFEKIHNLQLDLLDLINKYIEIKFKKINLHNNIEPFISFGNNSHKYICSEGDNNYYYYQLKTHFYVNPNEETKINNNNDYNNNFKNDILNICLKNLLLFDTKFDVDFEID